jgi:adenosylcobinamide hydrolase
MDQPDLEYYPDGDQQRPILVWRFAEPMLSISSAPLGGGIQSIEWIMNAGVSLDYSRTDPAEHLREIAEDRGLPGSGVGMLTAAAVEKWVWNNDEQVGVSVTVGLSFPTWAAAADGVVSDFTPGTINIVVVVPVRLGEAALVNAVISVTEAKTQALLERGVPGTGTASDAVVVVCSAAGPAEQFGGPRSLWGSRIARGVYAAVSLG